MANTPILEGNLLSVAATWDRRTAVSTINTRDAAISMFVFAIPYETSTGVIFDSALVWYSNSGSVQQVKRGIAANIQREATQLERMFNRSNR